VFVSFDFVGFVRSFGRSVLDSRSPFAFAVLFYVPVWFRFVICWLFVSFFVRLFALRSVLLLDVRWLPFHYCCGSVCWTSFPFAFAVRSHLCSLPVYATFRYGDGFVRLLYAFLRSLRIPRWLLGCVAFPVHRFRSIRSVVRLFPGIPVSLIRDRFVVDLVFVGSFRLVVWFWLQFPRCSFWFFGSRGSTVLRSFFVWFTLYVLAVRFAPAFTVRSTVTFYSLLVTVCRCSTFTFGLLLPFIRYVLFVRWFMVRFGCIVRSCCSVRLICVRLVRSSGSSLLGYLYCSLFQCWVHVDVFVSSLNVV